MSNPNLLNCLKLTRNTLTLSSTLHIFIYLPPFLPLSPPLSSFIYISLLIPLASFFPLSLPPSFSLLSFLPSSPFPSLILPSLYFASLLFSLLEAFSLNPTLHDTSYSSIFLSLYSPPSLPSFLSLPLPFYDFLLHI